MVSKCANPACNVPFLYFHQGKLYRRERAGGASASGNGSKKRTLEFFWLCKDCADKLTLTFEEGAMSIRPRPVVHATAA
jgi:hypothetical protein